MGFTSQLLDWRFLLGFILASAVFGVAWLYLAAFIFGWIGRLLGGRASPLELRAVLAWSAAPSILGLLVVLVLLAALRVSGGGSVAATTGGFSLLLSTVLAACGVWSVIVLLLMLSRVEQFGFWRALAVYVLGVVFVALAAALLIDTLLFHPFDAPSGSMTPTLLRGTVSLSRNTPMVTPTIRCHFRRRYFQEESSALNPCGVTLSCSGCRKIQ